MLRIFSITLLLLMLLGTFGRIARPSASGGRASAQQTAPAGSSAVASKVLALHREDAGSGLCEDLVITAEGSAVYSTCGNSIEKQYYLTGTERQQLQAWLKDYQAVDYRPNGASQAGSGSIQLYLNGQGARRPTAVETQQMIDFAIALDVKIALQS